MTTMTPRRPRSPYSTVRPDTIGHLRVLKANGVDLDIDGHQVRVDAHAIALPPKEFHLLRILMENAGRVIARRALLDAVWGTEYPDDNKTLNVHIMRVRKKIEPESENDQEATPPRIRTVRGLGYVFELGDW